ncbi:MAG: hypothetical protein ACR2QZ_06095 [Woeseiaceae bacterium]
MKYSSSNRGLPAGNPIANVFVILAGALIIAVSVVLGFVAFVVLGSIVAVFAAVIGLRIWWFNRKQGLRRGAGEAGGPSQPGNYIEGEYQVVEKDPDERADR